MNDLSSSNMKDIKMIKNEISEVNNISTENCKQLDEVIKITIDEVGKDITTMNSKIDQVEEVFPKYIGVINQAHEKLNNIGEDLDEI